MSDARDNPARGRFEMAGGAGTAFVEHRRAGERIVLLHPEVPRALSGRGVGSKLVRGTLGAVRAEGLKVVPRCGFVAAYVERHPECRDLRPKQDERRHRTGAAGFDGGARTAPALARDPLRQLPPR